MECYYDVNHADRFDELFGNSDIGPNPTPLRNSRLVMRFDFSKVPLKTAVTDLQQAFDDECLNSFRNFYSDHRQWFEKFPKPSSGDTSASLARFLQEIREVNRLCHPRPLPASRRDNQYHWQELSPAKPPNNNSR
ncbi:MAG: hypothetical protein DRP83_04565 [Planctomycetota bacterium]|nr:MAG: hypothetical protein DRP83_04565 [Planctomycetota bacterium]